MLILTPNDPLFNYNECEKLYNSLKEDIGEVLSFDDLLIGIDFYSFYENDKFLGCIYYYPIGKALFVNAFANRHHHKLNLECFKKSLSFYPCNIFARSNKKTSILCLLKSGFKRIGKNLYKLERSK